MVDIMKDALHLSKIIAVVGISDKSARTSFQVAEYISQYYTIIPVNPNITTWLGLRSFPSITDIPEDISVDLVNIFRRSEHVPQVVSQIITRNKLMALDNRVRYIWMQPGVLNESALQLAEAAGIKVICEKCIMVEHSAAT